MFYKNQLKKSIHATLLLLPIIFLSTEIVYAEGNAASHSHNGRQHSHPLPVSGLNHQHGGQAEKPSSTKQQTESNSVTPSIEQTERFLQHMANTAMVTKWGSSLSQNLFRFDGPKFSFVNTSKGGYEKKHVGDLRQLSVIYFTRSDSEGAAIELKEAGCEFTNVFAKCKTKCSKFTNRKGSHFYKDIDTNETWFDFCKSDKQNIKRFSNALKHLAAQYGADVKIEDPETTASAFD